MQIIEQVLKKIIGELGYEAPHSFALEHPKDESHGDYATNIALVLAKSVGKNPREVATQIVGSKLWESPEILSQIQRLEVAGPGFINFYLHDVFLFQLASEAATTGRLYGSNKNQVGQKIMVEYTDPNPFKELHIGHLMSNTIGESIARLKEAEGAEVVRSNYQGDVGLHVAKSIWGIMETLGKSDALIKMAEMAGQELAIRQKFLGQAYALGATKYEEDEGAQAEIQALNKVIYDGSDPVVMQLYKLGREWSLEYFEVIYKRLGTKFDQYFFESETGGIGLSVVDEGLSRGVLELGEGGAVVYHGEKDGLHTRVFRNKLGLPTYEAKELGLAVVKYERYKYDQSVVVTANEITEYFRVILSVMSQLYPELAAKTIHKPHGMMKLKSGKMSSRTGKVVTGEGLLDELAAVVLDKMGVREVADKALVADKVAVAALKYTVLKQAVGGDIVYEPETMTNLEGDTGPYLLYTYARAKSVLGKVKEQSFGVSAGLPAQAGQQTSVSENQIDSEPEEIAVIRYIYRYPEVVASAAKSFSPHMICSYLNELARRFNSFYAKCRIADAEDAERTRRVVLTQAVAQVLSNGLDTLGIATVEEM